MVLMFQRKKGRKKVKDLNQGIINTIRNQLDQSRKVLIITHQRPDGDAIGSLLAIGLPLITVGKNVQLVIKDGVPENFQFLAGTELVQKNPVGQFDYLIVVDSAEIERTNTDISGYGLPDLNIDHHKTNTNFAKINLVINDAVATAEILARYLPQFGLPITKPVADALLVGIVTDTIGFRTTNVNPDVLRLVADLMVLGGDLNGIYYKTIVDQSLSSARYWGAGLSKIQMEDGLVWTTLTLRERKAAGYAARDDADLVKILSAINGAKIALILTEQEAGYVKISWRLCGSEDTELDVSDIAQKFGGGGHKAAAGADVKGEINEVLQKALEETKISMNLISQPVD
jgi:phosphoesterase RecJ-like protein